MTCTTPVRRQALLPQQQGFTLVELMTVIVVLAILATLAAPPLASLVENQRARAASFDLVSDLLLARSEAAKRAGSGAVVRVSPRPGGWAAGWTVTLVSDSSVLSSRELPASFLSVSGAPNSISFDRDGRAMVTQDVRVTVRGVSQSAEQASCIQLDATGRARSTRGSCT
jgi:type IV fimbrial biogenesis protein FimT